ncbi:MAG: phosphatidate cytidylyltransferase [Burkholderiales bacterium]|nr:phosphatidate cytidylyltransferase [Burkholderiales bacterium]
MLRQRVITALILVGIMFAALAAPSPWPFALVTLGLLAAGAWEWGRLNGAAAAVSWALGALMGLAGIVAVASGLAGASPGGGWWIAVAVWALGGALVLKRGVQAWPHTPRVLRWLLGLALLMLAWAALIGARAIGINFMLSMLCVVWMADIAAYFGGKAWGRHKLAPAISPGKSWEGVWSGMAGVLVLAAVWMVLDRQFGFDGPSLYTRLVQGHGWVVTVLALLALCMLSVVGDLIESLVKRAAGAKDSSRLLPGHGGVLDRVDALLPVMPAVLALLSLTPR